MSGGGMGRDEGLGIYDASQRVYVKVDGNCFVSDVVVNRTKKLNVDVTSDVFYPVVRIVRPEMVLQEPVKAVDSANPVNDVADVTPLTNVVKKMEVTGQKKQRWKLWGSRLGTVAVAFIAIIAVTLVGMRLAGFRTFTVMSGSMAPDYPVGSLLYVKPVDYQSLKVGDVISFVADDDKTVVTHRISEIEIDKKDANLWRFRTKGDANTSADANLVHYKNVLGTPIVSIPLIGFLAYNVQQPPGIYIALVVGTLLLAWTFLPGTLEERRKTASKSIA